MQLTTLLFDALHAAQAPVVSVLVLLGIALAGAIVRSSPAASEAAARPAAGPAGGPVVPGARVRG